MYLPTVNGLRTFNALGMDVTIALYAAQTINAVGLNTVDFAEFIGLLEVGIIGASGTVQLNIQESDTVGGTYATIAGATKTLNATNTISIISVNAKHPDRKSFMRLQTVSVGATASTYGAMSMRVNPKGGVISNEASVVAVY